MNNINLLFDVSSLGIPGYIHAGHHRVIESVLYQQSKLNECNISLSAVIDDSLEYCYCLDYIKQHMIFKNLPFRTPQKHLLQKWLYENRNYFNSAINKSGSSLNLKSLYLKGLRKTLNYVIEKSYHWLDMSGIPADLSAVDIFYSPFCGIPQEIKKIKSIKCFMTVYDMIPLIYPEFFTSGILAGFNRTMKSIDEDIWIHCISQSTKNDLCNNFKSIDRSKIHVVHLAASPEIFYPCDDRNKISYVRKKYGIPQDVPYILNINTLEPRKNIIHTLNCFANLIQQEHVKDLYLVLAGDKGWDYDNIFKCLNNDLIKNRVIITGYIEDEDMASLYSDAMAFIYPSLYEGFGLPVLEAMQCGCPVITSNVSSLPEVVGDAGIMVSPVDSSALMQNILNIYNRPHLRKEMSAKSLIRAKQFSWKKCAEEMLEIYKIALR